MTAGLTSQRIAGTKVALAPAALGGLLGAALLAGSLIGAAITSELASVNSNGPNAVAATGSSLESQVLIQAQAGDRGMAAQAITGHVQDHIGLTERLFPIVATHVAAYAGLAMTTHVQDHIGLTERLFPIVATHVAEHGPLK